MIVPLEAERPVPAQPPAPLRAERLPVAYLINQYPQPSHSFIRREIQALEALGVRVSRFSLRQAPELVDAGDEQERARTAVVLSAGVAGLAAALVARAILHPRAFLRALILAVRMGLRSHRGAVRHLAYLAEACILVSRLRRDGVQHLHAHFGTNSAAVAGLCRALGGPPFSFTVHGPEEFDRPEALALPRKIADAAFVVAISSFGRSQLCRWARFEDWSKIEIVRCGLGADLLRTVVTAVPHAPRLVCVARLSEQKGHLLLVDAAARLVEEKIAFEIVLVGDGPLRPAIEARIAAHRLEGRFRLAGWMSGAQVREAILASRALVLPSFAEGLPVVLMEALALGRPVIATSIAGIPELVRNGVEGWLVAAGSAEALAQAMRAALTEPPERLAEMGRAGARRVQRDHDATREAQRLAALFAQAR